MRSIRGWRQAGVAFVMAMVSLVAQADLSGHGGGVLVTVPGVGLAPPADMNAFNPLLITSSFDEQAANLLYAPLLWVNRHLQINYALSVASGVHVGPRHRSYTVTLGRHWRWSDGRRVTAADVAYTYSTIVRLGPRFDNYGTGGIPTDVASFRVINPYTIRIVTIHPVNPVWFELNGLAMLIPLPAHVWSRFSIPVLYDRMAKLSFFHVVDGPFRLQSFRPGRYLTLVPNRRYSGINKPFLDRLVFRFLHSPESVFFALRAHRLQAGNLPPSLYMARHQLADYRTYTAGPVWGFNYMGFNYSNPRIAFVQDVRVRQAIQHAINQNLLIKVLYDGHGVRDYGPIPPVPATFMSPKARALEKRGDYDPSLARQLLRAAGWQQGPHGIRTRDGKRLIFTLALPPGTTRGPTLIKEMLAQVGIDMRLREEPFNQILAQTEDLHNKTWQAVYLAWGLSPYPSGGNIFACGAANNFYHYCNPALDRLLHAVTMDSGKQALYRYEDMFTRDQPLIVLPEYPIIVEVNRRLHGLSRAFTPIGGGLNAEYFRFGTRQTKPLSSVTGKMRRRATS